GGVSRRRVEAGPGGEDEAPAVGDPEVDRPRFEVVGATEQVLGGVDDIVGYPERTCDDVRRSAREQRDRDVGAGKAVDDLVERPVAAERDDDVITAVDRFATDLRR